MTEIRYSFEITDRRVVYRSNRKLTPEQEAALTAWVERRVEQFQRQLLGDIVYEVSIWNGQALAPQAGAHPAAAPAGAEPGAGGADPARVQPHWPFAYCGN